MWKIIAAVLGVASPIMGTLVWLLLLNSYRLEKKMLVKQVVKHVRAPDICSMGQAATSAAPIINPILLASDASVMSSVSHSGQLLLDGAPSVSPTDIQGRSACGNSGVYDPDDPILMAEPAEEVRTVAREIALRCMQRWDGFLGLKASTDSLKRPSGIWRGKFDGVRCATLLLAFRKLNGSLAYNQPGNTGV